MALAIVLILLAAGTPPLAGGSPITVRGLTSSNTSSGPHITLGVPAGTQTGDLLLVQILIKGGTDQTITAPSGFTLVLRNDDGTSVAQAVYRRFHASGDPTSYRFEFTKPEKKSAGMVVYAGVDPTNPIHAALGQVNPSSSTDVVAPSLTTTVSGARIVGVFGSAGSATFEPPSGMQEQFDLQGPGNGGPSLMVADQDLPSTGATGTRTAVASAGDHSIGQLVALRPASRQPTADAGPDQTVLEGASVTLDGSGSTDPDGDTLAYEWLRTGGPIVSLDDATATSPTFVAPAIATNKDDAITFQLTVTDPTGQADTDSVVVTVQNKNQAPVSGDDAFEALEDTLLTIASPGVLADDHDADSDALTVRLVTGTTRGVLTFNADGSFSYAPPSGEGGLDSFTYIANDGRVDGNPATVVLTIVPVNDAPIAHPDAYDLAEDETLLVAAAAGVLANDEDEDQDELTAQLVAAPTLGTLSLNADGSFQYTPDADLNGVDSFEYRAADATETSGPVTVTLTIASVNDPPTARDDAFTIDEDTAPTSLDVLANDATEPDEGETLTVVSIGAPSHGVASPGADGLSILYQPDPNFAGSDSFAYVVGDGNGATDAALVTIDVRSINDEPVLEPIGDRLVAEDELLSFFVHATDIESEPTLSASGKPAGATFDPSTGLFSWTPGFDRAGLHTVTFTASDGEATDSETIIINVSNVNRAPVLGTVGDREGRENQSLQFTIRATDPDGEAVTYSAEGLPAGATLGETTGAFAWTPSFDQAGAHTLTFVASDGDLEDRETVTLTIGDAPRAPLLGPIGDKAVAEAQALTFTVTATDPDGTTPTLFASGVPAGATFNAGTGAFEWTPTFQDAGSYEVTFTASDDSASDSDTITLTVTNVNRAPVLAPIGAKSAAESATIAFTVSASDADGTTPALSASTLPTGAAFDASTGAFQWTPDYDQAGSHAITFAASDGDLADQETVVFTIANTNRPPVLAPLADVLGAEGEPIQFLVVATDPDQTALTLGASGLPAGATFDAATGAFSWTPGFDQAGAHATTFSVTDGAASAEDDVSFTILDTNREPVLVPIGNQDVAEGETLAFTVVADDPDGTTVALAASPLPEGALFDEGTGAFTWTPDHAQAGSYAVTFTANDGEAADQETLTITVADTNRAPVLKTIGPYGISESRLLIFQVNASDPDGTTPTLQGFDVPRGASFDRETGTFSWTPDFDQAGTYDVRFAATDGFFSDEEVVRLTVRDTNRAPVLDEIGPQETTEGVPLEFAITASDPDGSRPALSVTGLPAGATFDTVTGAFAWAPTFSQAGLYPLTVEANDGEFITALHVDVTVHDAPVATQLSIEDQPAEATSLAPFSIVVHLLDEEGAFVGDGTRTVTLAKASGPADGVLGGTLTQLATDGFATFPDLTLDLAGDYTISAAAIGLLGTVGTPFRVAPSLAHHVAFERVPGVVESGQAFDVVVHLEDAAGNVATTATDTVTLELGSGDGSLSGTTSVAAAEGIALFQGVELGPAGTFELLAASGSLGNATSDPIIVTQTASHLRLTSAPASIESGARFAVVVEVVDESGDLVVEAALTIVLDLAEGPESGTLRGSKTGTAIEGQVVFEGLRLDLAGTYLIRASSSGLPEILSDPILVTPGPPRQLRIMDAPRSIASGATFALTVHVLDEAGNLVTSASSPVTLSLESQPAGGALVGTSSGPAVGGIGVFPGLALSPSGTYVIGAASPGLTSGFTVPIPANPASAADVRRIELTPTDVTLVSGNTRAFTARAYDALEGGALIPGIAFEFDLVPSDTQVGSLNPQGVFKARRAGDVEVRARLGSLGSNAATVTVEPGPLAQILFVPGAAVMDASTPVDFLAEGRDAMGNPVPLGNVEWIVDGQTPGVVLGPQETFTFPAGALEGPHEIMARAGGRHGSAVVHVTTRVAPADEVTELGATAVTSDLHGSQMTIYSVGLAEAAQNATVSILAPAATDASGLLAAARVELQRPAQNLAIIVETRLGDLDAPPEETDAANLAELLENMVASTAPALFVRVHATEGGQPLPSSSLNALLGTMDIQFLVPVEYFDVNGFDPVRVRLIEYSDGALITSELFADRVGTTGDGSHHVFNATIDEFSAFAIIGAALAASAPGPSGGAATTSTGSGTGLVLAPIIDRTATRTLIVRTTDSVIPRIDFLVPANLPSSELGSQRVRVFDQASPPTGVAPVPRGVLLSRYFEAHSDADVRGADVHVVIPVAEISDASQGVLLHYVNQVWVPESRLNLVQSGDEYVGTASTSCCSYFAVGFDRESPSLAIAVPGGIASGLVKVPANVKDNLKTTKVEFYVDDRLAFTDYAAPYDFLLNTAKYQNGTHSIRALAYDFVGNVGEIESTATFRNSQIESIRVKEIEAGAGPGLLVALVGPLAFLVLLVVAVGFAFGRTRRTTAKSLRELAATQGGASVLAAAGSPITVAPSARPDEPSAAPKGHDNPLVPDDWL